MKKSVYIIYMRKIKTQISSLISVFVIHLRNKFHFSEVHGSMNATGQVQSK